MMIWKNSEADALANQDIRGVVEVLGDKLGEDLLKTAVISHKPLKNVFSIYTPLDRFDLIYLRYIPTFHNSRTNMQHKCHRAKGLLPGGKWHTHAETLT